MDLVGNALHALADTPRGALWSGEDHHSIDRIKEVRAVRSLLASSALSIDRLEIRYEPHGVIMVSPRERERFMEQLDHLRASSR
jgi:hypothetical protein